MLVTTMPHPKPPIVSASMEKSLSFQCQMWLGGKSFSKKPGGQRLYVATTAKAMEDGAMSGLFFLYPDSARWFIPIGGVLFC
jgi:hypothetical protein